jgi:hypothetical protein
LEGLWLSAPSCMPAPSRSFRASSLNEIAFTILLYSFLWFPEEATAKCHKPVTQNLLGYRNILLLTELKQQKKFSTPMVQENLGIFSHSCFIPTFACNMPPLQVYVSYFKQVSPHVLEKRVSYYIKGTKLQISYMSTLVPVIRASLHV